MKISFVYSIILATPSISHAILRGSSNVESISQQARRLPHIITCDGIQYEFKGVGKDGIDCQTIGKNKNLGDKPKLIKDMKKSGKVDQDTDDKVNQDVGGNKPLWNESTKKDKIPGKVDQDVGGNEPLWDKSSIKDKIPGKVDQDVGGNEPLWDVGGNKPLWDESPNIDNIPGKVDQDVGGNEPLWDKSSKKDKIPEKVDLDVGDADGV